MKNTLTDLNNYLFEQMERLTDDSLTEDQLELELKKTDGIIKVSETIIHNGELAFRVIQHADQHGYGTQKNMPKMLSTEGEW